LTSTSPFSASIHTTVECGEPSALSVVTTARWPARRNASPSAVR
jgi:hypothetical protein